MGLGQQPERLVLNGVAHDYDPSWFNPAVERAARAIYEAYKDADFIDEREVARAALLAALEEA